MICHTHRHGPTSDWTAEDIYECLVRKIAGKRFEFKTHYIDNVIMRCTLLVVSTTLVSTASVVIADGAGSFLDLGEPIKNVGYEFETIFDATCDKEVGEGYANRFDTVKHIGTREPCGMFEQTVSM